MFVWRHIFTLKLSHINYSCLQSDINLPLSEKSTNDSLLTTS